MRTDVVERVLRESEAGAVVFPEVVRRLVEAGVESYFTDFVRGETTFHGGQGGSHRVGKGLGGGMWRATGRVWRGGKWCTSVAWARCTWRSFRGRR